jgi:hypothetical protein
MSVLASRLNEFKKFHLPEPRGYAYRQGHKDKAWNLDPFSVYATRFPSHVSRITSSYAQQEIINDVISTYSCVESIIIRSFLAKHNYLIEPLSVLPEKISRIWSENAAETLRLELSQNPDDGQPELIILFIGSNDPFEDSRLLDVLINERIEEEDPTLLDITILPGPENVCLDRI